jgi:hypothetical protein
MAEAEDGSLWIETSWGLARRLTDGRTVFYLSSTFAPFGNRSFLLDQNSRVWYARGLELYVMNPEPLASLTQPGPIIPRSIKPSYVLPAIAGKEIRLPDKPGEICASPWRISYAISAPDRQTADLHLADIDKELLEFDAEFHRFTTTRFAVRNEGGRRHCG